MIGMQISYVESVLAAKDYVVVDFVPVSPSQPRSVYGTLDRRLYHNVNAACFGLGNFDIGPMKSRKVTRAAIYRLMVIVAANSEVDVGWV